MKQLFTILAGIFMLIGCASDPDKKSTQESNAPEYPNLLTEVWDAHGGIDNWKSQKALTFTVNEGSSEPEKHFIDLQSRMVRIESDSFMLGMDGSSVWVAPNPDAIGTDPRFYHNLLFYFFAIPYVMGDPGVNIEDAGNRSINGNTYRALQATFDEGTGDADDDEYILLVNPGTKQLEWLLYTVTYFSKEKGTRYNALHYGNYDYSGGLAYPGILEGYTYANDTTGSLRYSNTFSNVEVSVDPFDKSLFSKPENAVIAE